MIAGIRRSVGFHDPCPARLRDGRRNIAAAELRSALELFLNFRCYHPICGIEFPQRDGRCEGSGKTAAELFGIARRLVRPLAKVVRTACFQIVRHLIDFVRIDRGRDHGGKCQYKCSLSHSAIITSVLQQRIVTLSSSSGSMGESSCSRACVRYSDIRG